MVSTDNHRIPYGGANRSLQIAHGVPYHRRSVQQADSAELGIFSAFAALCVGRNVVNRPFGANDCLCFCCGAILPPATPRP